MRVHAKSGGALPVLITARLGSSRLPAKHLLALRGERAAIACMIDRLRTTGLRLVLCVPDDPADEPLCQIAAREGIDAFSGDSNNVLRRYHQALDKLGAPASIIVDGDDPFVSTEAIGEMAEAYDGHDVILCDGYPYGGAPFLLGRRFLGKLLDTGVTPDGWSRFLDTVPGKKARIVDSHFTEAERGYRLSLDYPEDLAFIRHIYASFPGDAPVSLGDVVAFITAHTDELTQRFPEMFDGRIVQAAARHLCEGGGEGSET